MKLRKGDKILVISGKDRGKTSKIARVFPRTDKIIVEDVNVRKKHTRPKKEGQKGQVVQVAMPVDVSNVKLICGKCQKTTRVGYKILEGGKKIRICKKCQGEI
jgi:large subunit ribosomal protein L24